MRDSLKKRLFAHLYSILVISCTFALVQKKNLFTFSCVFFCKFCKKSRGSGGSMSYVAGSNSSYKPITNTAWVRTRLCKLQKGYTRLAAACDKVYQLLVHGRWFSPGTPASSTTKTGRHDIAEILLKVALNTKNESISQSRKVDQNE